MATRIEFKLTFIHINQNAGTSVTRFLADNFFTSHSARQHDTFGTIKPKWQRNAFAVVRNTYDRVVSLYEHDRSVFASDDNPTYKKELELLNKGFDHYVKFLQHHRFNKKLELTGSTRRTWTEQTQLRFLPKDLTTIKLINFHNLEEKLYAFLKSQDLVHKKPLKQFNKTPTRTTRDYRTYYTDETKAIVDKVFKKEIETLKFKF